MLQINAKVTAAAANPTCQRKPPEEARDACATGLESTDAGFSPLLPIDCIDSDLRPVYDEIFVYVFFVHPVSYFEAERTGAIGFLAKVK
jgi:hypothetical protein